MNTNDKEPPTYRGVSTEADRSIEATIDDAYDAGFEAGASWRAAGQRAMYGDYGPEATDPDRGGAAIIICVVIGIAIAVVLAGTVL